MRCLIKVSWWCAPMTCFTDRFCVILMKPKSNTLNIMSMGCLMGVDILKTKWRYPKFPDVYFSKNDGKARVVNDWGYVIDDVLRQCVQLMIT